MLSELYHDLDAAYCEERARLVVALGDGNLVDQSAPWRRVCGILEKQPPLLASFACLLFRDALIADEGLHAAADFADYLLLELPGD